MSNIVLTDGRGIEETPARSLKDAAKVALKANLNAFLEECKGDPIQHAEVVAGGPSLWRRTLAAELGPYFSKNRTGVDDLANHTFRFLAELWSTRTRSGEWVAQHGMWRPTPGQFLDAVDIPSPPTPEEIEDGWEVEIGSSESAMRTMYPGESARVRRGADVMRGVDVS